MNNNKFPISAQSTEKNRTGQWRAFRPIVDKKKCISCRICQNVCPDSCIRLKPKAEINYDYCKGCGVCAEECPVEAIRMVEESKKCQ